MLYGRAVPTATQRLLSLPDVEEIFQAFVRNANALGAQARTARAPTEYGGADRSIEASSEIPVPERDSAPAVISLGAVPISGEPQTQPQVFGKPTEEAIHEELAASREELLGEPVSRTPGSTTQRLEAEKLVPDVESVRPPKPPVPERSEDGQIPARELDRMMADMTVLLRYGHRTEVADQLDELLRKYPEDLLLLRRVAEFHLETGSRALAIECLFRLATGLFERRNIHGMRAALEQVQVLDPENARAHKLLSLLERREA